MVCAVGGVPITKLAGGSEWRQRYDARFPDQFQIYSPNAFDATMVLVDAMKRAGSADPAVYLPFIAKANYKGVTTTVQFEPNGELKNPTMTFYAYKEGKQVALN